MIKLKVLIYIVFFLFIIANCYSQNDTTASFEYDYCLFRGEGSKSLIEFYYSFSQKNILFIKTETGFEAAGKISLSITNLNTNIKVIENEYKIPLSIKDTAGYNKTASLLGQINILLDSGSYKLNIKGGDFNNPASTIENNEAFKLVPFPSSKVVLSSVQLSTNIFKSNEQTSIFYKNTLEVEPNPSRIFGNNFSKLYYYFEVYNLLKELITDNYTINISIIDNDGTEIKSAKKKYKLQSEAKVETGIFEVGDINTGVYNIQVNIQDINNNKLLESKKKFYIYNSGLVQNNQQNSDDNSYLQSDIAGYSKEQLIKEYEQSSYLMKDAAKETFEKLTDLTSQKKYFYNFWKSLDPTPLTSFNEFKKEYFDRVKYSDKNFKYQNKEGWITDRGRVYCIYGKPSDIEKHYFEGNTKAYEIWKYDAIQGGVEFDFVDITSDGGDFVLVNSTAKNELSDDNWQRRLQIRN